MPKIPRGERLLNETFKTNARWTNVAGTWAVEGGNLGERSPEADFAWTVAGERSWKDTIVEAEVRTAGGSEIVFLCARWRDVDNHYELQYLEYPGNCVRLVRVRGGERMILAEVRNMPDLRIAPFTKVWLEASGNRLRAYRNGELLLEARDGTFDSGQIALGTTSEHRVSFDNVNVYALKAAKDDVPNVELTQPVQRHAFYREEKEANVRFVISTDKSAKDLSVEFVLASERYPMHGDLVRRAFKLGAVFAGKERKVAFKFTPADWRSGDYVLTATVEKDGTALARERTKIYIRRKPNPDRMLVQAWDMGDAKRLAEHGFNRFKILHDNTMSRWKSDGTFITPDNPLRMFSPGAKAKRQSIIDDFDDALKHGMWGYIQIHYIRRVPEGVVEAYALRRNGKDLQDRAGHGFDAGARRPNPWHPKVAEVDADFFRKALAAWKDLPAWHAVLLNSETENALDVFGNDYWLAMAKKELGFDVPEDAVGSRWPEKGRTLPEDGIVDSDDPHYRFYRWWWERGQGQGHLHAEVAKAIKDVREDVITWHDPALRQPFVRGRFAGLDEVLNWSYAWPNVARFPLRADEFRRAAAEGQNRIFMIQVIVWGSVAIPRTGPHWPHIKRDMYLPAHSPAIIREATWLALSRGISGVSYHALETTDNRGMTHGDARKDIRGVGYRSYLYSNPDTLLTIKDMSERVMQPYGMVFKNLAPVKGQVAMLLSTANSVLARRDPEDFILGEAGHLAAKLQAAHVPVDPLYEIDIEEGKLEGYKAIALPGCRVLPRHIYDAVKAFADAGGLVIADQYLVPKFENVLTLPRENGKWGEEGPLQEEHIAQAKIVRKALDGKITRWADCDSASVILSTLEDGPNRLLFVVNNLREQGDYMRPWGRVLDDGVAQTATVTVPETDCVIYDVLDQRAIEPERNGGRLNWTVTLGPGEGRVFAVRPTAITRVAVDVPEAVKKGDEATIAIAVEDADGPVTGLVPVRVTITDSQGVESDYSDYYLAQDGRATVTLPIARNEPSGAWSVTARELYGGVKGRAFFRVSPVENNVVVAARAKKTVKPLPGLVEVPEMWLFRKDPKRVGAKEKWFAPGGKTEGWQRLSTHDFWDTAAGVGYEGDGWYAVDLVIPSVEGKRVKLVFGAVDENYTLWVNGKYVSNNLDAGTTMWDKPVTIDITDYYEPGEANHIVVRVKNTLRAGGIWKPVRIVAE